MTQRRYRIVALSATPGDSSNKVQDLLINLKISNIELRSELSMDVRQYVHNKDVHLVVVPLGPILGPLQARFLKDVLQPILDRLLSRGAIYSRDADKAGKFQLMQQRKSWLAKVNPATGSEQIGKDRRGMIEGDFMLIGALYHGYECMLTHGLNVMMNHFKDDKSDESVQVSPIPFVPVALDASRCNPIGGNSGNVGELGCLGTVLQ